MDEWTDERVYVRPNRQAGTTVLRRMALVAKMKLLSNMVAKQLADDVVILKLIVTSSYGEVSGPCAQPNRVDTPNSPNFGL